MMDDKKPDVAHGLTRRCFIQTAALAAAALRAPKSMGAPRPDLEMDFATPPDFARMWTWWFWLADRVDKQSITTDLEELKAKGVGGVTVYSLSGPGVEAIDYMSPPWRELFKHTVSEANRLGLGVSTMLCSGWNAGGPWIKPEQACKQYTHSELTLTGPQAFSGQLPQPPSDQRFYRDVAVFAFRVNHNSAAAKGDPAQQKAREELLAWKSGRASYGKSGTTPIREICEAPQRPLPGDNRGLIDVAIDVTSSTHDGKLDWDVPEGNWTVVRFGYTLTGKMTTWSSPSGQGLEADPFDAQSMDVQFANIASPLLREVGSLGGKVFGSVQIDSWESGLPNWTSTFLDQFRKYRGYDARPYLPGLVGWTIGTPEITDRFLYDYRKTLGDSIADNYFDRLSQLAQREGIIQQSEAGGVCYPVVMSMDALKNLGRCTIPMAEFWQSGDWQEKGQNTNGKQTASAAHLYGKGIVAAEAFSSFLHWKDSPATLKPTADRAFCEGLNHFFIFSSATHSGDGFPGTEFTAGTHFNRKITWWNQARAFTDYIARCSHLLQQGLFVADVLFYNGDGCPNFIPPKHVDPSLGRGYDYDVCNTEVLLTRLTVRDGRIQLPDGMSYRLLVLPERNTMSVEVIQKLKDLVAQGVTIVGPPPEKAPGLKDYPECDRAVKTIANELWANCDGQNVKEHAFEKGRIIWGITLREILTRNGIEPDFEYSDGQADTFLDWIHRSVGTRHIYFVANRNDRMERVTCTFRVGGKEPEIWDPVTGEIRNVVNVAQTGGRTSVPLEFAPHESMFIVFRERMTAGRRKPASNTQKLSTLAKIEGPWTVRFDPRWGGPESAEFVELESWTKRPEEGIKYYSGSATYSSSFKFSGKPGQVLFLDLGEVKEIAEVHLNGKKLGVAWTKPFRVEASGAVKVGENKLEIDVVNLWPNRLIRDGQLPLDKRLTTTNVKEYYEPQPGGHELLDSGLLGPVRLMVAES
jgi:hypothetical protein